MKEPKFLIGDTVILRRRWFLWFREYVLCEVVGGRWVTDNKETYYNGGKPQWRYTLKIGNQFKRFCLWEDEIVNN